MLLCKLVWSQCCALIGLRSSLAHLLRAQREEGADRKEEGSGGVLEVTGPPGYLRLLQSQNERPLPLTTLLYPFHLFPLLLRHTIVNHQAPHPDQV